MRYLFVVNPFSGAGKGETTGRLLNTMLPEHPAYCDGRGRTFLVNQLDSGRLRDVLSGAEAVVAVGGDGTASSLIPHILRCSSPPALGLIPLGTSNDLARAVGVSVRDDYTDRQTLRETLDRLSGARHVKLDVLAVNEKVLFCNYFSIGLDAAIVRDFDNIRNSRWARLFPPGRATNNLLYFLMGLKNAGFHLEPPVEIEYSDQSEGHRVEIDSRCRAIIVSNLPFYAGGCPIRPDARTDDGLFEITIVRSAYQFITLIATRFLPFLRLPSGLRQYRARHATIYLSSPSPSQIDGDRCCEAEAIATRLKISLHATLRVLRPRSPM
ncbi:MAG: hypothetical protein JSV16_17090 [Candidatus Hydrogenedentota bacterium]|nr:MAG: hypothetical protein JSV16_17090 [Candidatus Hydrogenedentota bacterium]